jgi:hypothetical protein
VTLERWSTLGAFAAVLLFLFVVVIGPDLLFPALGLPRPSRTPPGPEALLATHDHPARYIADLATLLLSASFILVTVGLHNRLQATAPTLARHALVAGVIGGVVGMVGVMVMSYSRAAIAAIEDPAIAHAALTTTQSTGIGIAVAGFMFVGVAFLLSGWAGVGGGGLPQALAWLLVVQGAIFILYSLLAPLSPGFGGLAGLLLGAAAPLVTLVGLIWLGIVLWRG